MRWTDFPCDERRVVQTHSTIGHQSQKLSSRDSSLMTVCNKGQSVLVVTVVSRSAESDNVHYLYVYLIEKRNTSHAPGSCRNRGEDTAPISEDPV